MKTLDEVIAKFPTEILKRFDFSNATYKGALVRMEGIKCSIHGEFSQYAAQLRKNGAACPKCGDALRTANMTSSEVDYIARVQVLHKASNYDYSHIGFTKMNAPITIGCPIHGDFVTSANKHLYRKDGCPSCAPVKRRERFIKNKPLMSAAKIANTAKTFFEECSQQHADFYTYPEQEYLGAKHKIRVICPTHGEFQQAAWAHLNGTGCRRCGHKSKGEDGVASFIGQFTRVERGRRDLLDGKKEIDIWLPEFNMGVEYHGLYHHTTAKKGKIHKEKWQMAQTAGIRLVQIFEDEWLNKQDIVKARLLAFLGKAEKRDARKLELKLVQWKYAKEFLVATHIQGAGPVGTAYGLYENETLVAVATFGKSRSGAMTGSKKEGEYEVLRYASLGTVRGGFTRLFKTFLKDFAPDKVISYCDLRYGTGNLYEAAGFELDCLTEPDYWWVMPGKIERVSRYAVQKHKIAQPDHPLHSYYAETKTEVQICEEAGWEKIHGVGNQRWVWRPQTSN